MSEKIGGNILSLTLPWPPSVNTYWRTFRGRMIISKAGRAYRKQVAGIVGLAVGGSLTEKLRVSIQANQPDRRRRDLDNLLKAPLDALAHAGVYEDDSQISDLRIYWGQRQKPGCLVVTVEVFEDGKESETE